MKILQLNKYFYQKGGAETVFFNTISTLENRGHQVIPFALKNKKNKFSEYESYFVDYPELSESNIWTKITNIPSFIYNRQAAKQLERLILDKKPDIAHIHLLFNSLSVSILPVLQKYRIPTVMTVHDYRLICPAYTLTNGKGKICELCKDRHFIHCTLNRCSNGNLTNSMLLSLENSFRSCFYEPLNYIDKFIFVSKFAQKKHIEFNPGYASKAVQLYNFTPDIPTRINKKVNHRYLLYFGRLSNEKGINSLLEAIRDIPEIDLKIIGRGPLSKEIGNNYPKNVSFLGFKEGQELKEYVKNALFTIVPSEWYENNPLSIIESLSLGTPVIGSNIGGIPELIQDEKTGFTFTMGSPADLTKTIRKAIAIPEEKLYEMSIACNKFAQQHFSADKHFNYLISIYQSILKASK